MGGFLALKFSENGYDFNQNPIKVGGKLKESRKFHFNSVSGEIGSKMFVVQYQAITRSRKSPW